MSHPPGTIDDVPPFQFVSPFRPAGDQPEAIAGLVAGLERGDRYQTLLGITGSGKTATIAWTIESVQRPTLIIEPNKSLAAQLAAELKEFFPRNRVEYFVSYYDYYQPEAYVPSSDTYIEKDSSINDEIDRLRHASTSSLLLRPDTIVVASVSCIYGLGSPEEYRDRIVALHPGEDHEQRALLKRLVELQYSRNDVTLSRGQFRVHGDTVEIHPAYESRAVRIEFFGDTVERIRPFDVLTGEIGDELEELVVFANTHYGTGDERMRRAVLSIEDELRDAWTSSSPPASCSRPSGCGCAPSTTSRCSPRRGCAAGWRTTAATSTAGPRVRRPSPCSTSSPRTSWWSWTSPTWPCPRSAASTPGTGPARRPWSTTGSDCRRPWTTGRYLRRVRRADRADHPAVGHPGPVGARAQRQRGRAGHPPDGPGRPRGRHPPHHRPDRRPP